MTKELIERLRTPVSTNAPYEPHYTIPPPQIQIEAADAIERLASENTQLGNNNVWQAGEISKHLDTIERLTAELAAMKESRYFWKKQFEEQTK